MGDEKFIKLFNLHRQVHNKCVSNSIPCQPISMILFVNPNKLNLAIYQAQFHFIVVNLLMESNTQVFLITCNVISKTVAQHS